MTEIELTLDPGAKDPLAVVDYVAPEPQTVDRFEFGTAPAGFTVRTPRPEGVSWRDAERVLVVFTLDDGKVSVTSDLERLVNETDSAGGKPDDYLLGGRFFNENEVLDGDGMTTRSSAARIPPPTDGVAAERSSTYADYATGPGGQLSAGTQAGLAH